MVLSIIKPLGLHSEVQVSLDVAADTTLAISYKPPDGIIHLFDDITWENTELDVFEIQAVRQIDVSPHKVMINESLISRHPFFSRPARISRDSPFSFTLKNMDKHVTRHLEITIWIWIRDKAEMDQIVKAGEVEVREYARR